jgi:hypothetical protein
MGPLGKTLGNGAVRFLGISVWPCIYSAPVAAVFSWVAVFETTKSLADRLLASPPAHETACGVRAACAEPMAALAFVGARIRLRPPFASTTRIGLALCAVRFGVTTFAGSALFAALGGSVVRSSCRRARPESCARSTSDER